MLSKNNKKIRKVIEIIVLLWVVVFLSLSLLLEHFFLSNNSKSSVIINAVFIVITTVIFAKFIFKLGNYTKINFNFTNVQIISILIFATLIPRFVLVNNIQCAQFSDYEGYWQYSKSLFETSTIFESGRQYLATVASNQTIIATIFSLAYYIFGESVQAALYLNIIFSIGTVLFFYYICFNFMDKSFALIAAFIYAIWPNNILSSLYMLSEPMYTFFLFLGIALMLYCKELSKYKKYTGMLIAGVLLQISQQIRNVTSIFIIAIIICFIIYNIFNTKEENIKSKALSMIILIVGYKIAAIGFSIYIENLIGTVSKPAIGWPLYLGTHTANWGEWAQEPADYLTKVINENPIKDVQKVLLNKAVENIKNYDINVIVELVLRKIATVFGNNNSFYLDYNATVINNPENILRGQMPSLIWAWSACSNWFYLMTILGYIYICLRGLYNIIFKKINMKNLCYFSLPIAGIIALHCIIFVSPRYNYPTIPLMIAACIWYLNKKSELEYKI